MSKSETNPNPQSDSARSGAVAWWLVIAGLVGGAALQALVLAGRFFQGSLNSDFLLPHAFLRALFVEHYPVTAWAFGFATFWFPDYPVYLPCYWLGGDTGLSYPLYAVAWWCLLGWVFGFAAEAVGARRREAVAAGFAAVNLLLALQHTKSHGVLLWQLCIPAYHGGSVLFGLLLMGIVVGSVRKGDWSRGRVAGGMVVLSLGLLSDGLFLLHFVLPLLLVMGWGWWRGKIGGRMWGTFAGMFISALALVAATWLALRVAGIFFHQSLLRHWPSLRQTWRSVRQFASDLVGHLVPEHPAFWVLAAIALVLAGWLLMGRWRRDSSAALRVAAGAGAVGLLAGFAAAACCGLWRDANAVRYLWNWLVVPLWVICCVALMKWQRRPWFGRALLCSCGAVCLLSAACSWGKLDGAKLRFPRDEAPVELRQYLLQRGLTSGLCDYWSGHFLTMAWGGYDGGGPALHCVHHMEFPRFYCNTAFSYLVRDPRTGSYSRPAYQFILLDRLDRQALRERIGGPLNIVQVGKHEIMLLTPEQSRRVGDIVIARMKKFLRKRQWESLRQAWNDPQPLP